MGQQPFDGRRSVGGASGALLAILESIAIPLDVEDLGVMEQAVEDGGGGGDAAEDLTHCLKARLVVRAMEPCS